MQADFLERESDAGAPGAPLRKAAMLLHSMAESDRRWMLARVDPAQRLRLDSLLAELVALEFPADADLVRESLATGARKAAAPASRPMDLTGWSADEAARMLLPEPDDLIALLLRAGDWNWTNALRVRLGADRVRAVDASRYSTAEQVSAALIEAAMKAAWSRFLVAQDAPARQRLAKAPATARHSR